MSTDDNLVHDIKLMVNKFIEVYQENVNLPVTEIILIVTSVMAREQGATVKDLDRVYAQLMDMNRADEKDEMRRAKKAIKKNGIH